MLMQAGYPPAVVRIGERNQYLAALRRADAGEDDDFLAFIGEHVFESLELFVRAAKGEDIQEPTDLEKEIVLLKMQLSQNEELAPRTPEAIERVFATSLDPLYLEILRLLSSLCDLFEEATVNVAGLLSPVIGTQNFPRHPTQTQFCQPIEFNLKRFRRDRCNDFDLSASLELRFEKFKYSLRFSSANPPLLIQHFYQEPLTRDEVTEFAQQLTRYFLEGIKSKTKPGV
jgi:hypothetical protein